MIRPQCDDECPCPSPWWGVLEALTAACAPVLVAFTLNRLFGQEEEVEEEE